LSIEKLEEVLKSSYKEGKPSFYCVEAASIFIKIVNILKNQSAQIIELKGKIKALEQAKTFFPMTEDKHRALLNNCVDDDEAILHKREIKEGD
jgi:hypothetical protein